MEGNKMNEFKYLITDIQVKTNVSITSLNAFKKKHQEFFSKNSIRKQRKLYYNQAAMDLFVSYYCQDPEENPLQNDEHAEGYVPIGKNSNEMTSYTDKTHESQPEALKAEIDALKAEIGVLRKQLEDKEAERLELLRQNGALILTLQQEKQEKMLLLPPPKKSLGEKVKSIFHKDKA